MNTLTDTDEGKARPSVWPVYLAIGAVVAISLLFGLTGLVHVVSSGKYGWWVSPAWAGFYAVYGLLGAVGAVGLTMLRPWGYWCAVAWAVIGIVTAGFLWLGWYGPVLVGDLVLILFVWTAKPEGEE